MESFNIDQQTKDDLEIFQSTNKNKSIFSYFDNLNTIGGQVLLKNIFKNPLNDLTELQYRNTIIKHFIETEIELNLNKEVFDFIEFYLRNNDRPSTYSYIKALENSFRNLINSDQHFYIKKRGVNELLDFINNLRIGFLSSDLQSIVLFEELNTLTQKICNDLLLKKCLDKRPKPLGNLEIEKCDFAFRNIYIKEIRQIIDITYKLDVYISVAKTSNKYNLTLPIFNTSNNLNIDLKGVFHLFLDHPVSNDINLNNKENVLFVTGVNMSGKSTIIKAFAIAVYLAHLGFPVPAISMKTNVLNGLLTTINLSDDLSKGHSHFYNEVKRLKTVSEIISKTNNVLIIFDELFRGTNVKDAYEASLLVIDLFSKINDNFFIISTHIIEVAKELKNNPEIKFQFLETIIEGQNIKFNYKLQNGITMDHIGLWIINNEGIIEILQQKISFLNKTNPN